jgi:hypothetical protein
MRLTAIVAFVAVVHIGSASIAAQQPPDAETPKANPYGNLFAPPGTPPPPQRFLFPTPAPRLAQPPAAPRQQPAVVCGLTLIPGDPNADPAIRRDATEDGTRYVIRPVDPKICRR